MKKTVKYIFIISLFIFCSCTQSSFKESSGGQLIQLNVKLPDSYVKNYSSVFSEVKKIDLETRSDCLIGEIRSLSIVDNEIFIIQQVSSYSSLLRFNGDGKYLNEIGTYGKGPGEIMNPRSFIIDNGLIEVWSRLNISRFTRDGQFVEKVFNAFYPGVGFYKKSGYYFLFHSASPPAMLAQYRSTGEKIAEYLPYHFINAESGNDKVLLLDDKITLFSSVCDTIYQIIDEGITSEGYFNFIGFESPVIALKKYDNILDFVRNLKNYCVITNYLENSDFILFEYSYNRKVYYSIYNKIKKTQVYFNDQIIDDLGNSVFSSPLFLTSDNYLIIPQYSEKIRDKSSNNETESDPTAGIINNPVLIFCKLKADWK